MNNYQITTDDLNAMVSMIAYYHAKIREGSQVLGESFDLISEELISEISDFIEIENPSLELSPITTAP